MTRSERDRAARDYFPAWTYPFPMPDDPRLRRALLCVLMREQGCKLREIAHAIHRSRERARMLVAWGRQIIDEKITNIETVTRGTDRFERRVWKHAKSNKAEYR